jgi:hypothetical protein
VVSAAKLPSAAHHPVSKRDQVVRSSRRSKARDSARRSVTGFCTESARARITARSLRVEDEPAPASALSRSSRTTLSSRASLRPFKSNSIMAAETLKRPYSLERDAKRAPGLSRVSPLQARFHRRGRSHQWIESRSTSITSPTQSSSRESGRSPEGAGEPLRKGLEAGQRPRRRHTHARDLEKPFDRQRVTR